MPFFCPKCGTLMIMVGGRLKCPRCGYIEGEREEAPPQINDRDGLFPFSEIREGQRQFLNDCRETVKDGGHLIAHAPTGIGKTAAALTAALEDSIENNRITFFLTSKRSQHRIAVETIKRMNDPRIKLVDIISKQEMCPKEESRMPYQIFSKLCEEMVKKGKCEFYRSEPKLVEKILEKPMHVEELVDLARKKGVCPHRAALEAISNANVVVCDYALIFTDISEKLFSRIQRPLSDINIIVDEAHNLPDRLRADLHSFMNLDTLDEVRRSLSNDGLLSGVVKRLRTGLEERLREIGNIETEVGQDFFLDALESALKGSLEPLSLEEFRKKLYDIGTKEAINGGEPSPIYLAQFIDVWMSESRSVIYMASGREGWLKCALLDPSVLSSPIFEGVHSSVLMSGTLYPGQMYADILGIPDAAVEEYESPYPAGNRKVVLTDFLTTLYSRRNRRMYQAYANHIVDAARICPGNIAVFFPSYGIMEKIMERMELMEHPKEMIIERRNMGKREREGIVKELKSASGRGGALLLGVQGGSLSEGVDYYDNILSTIMIAGLAVAPPNIETEALRRYYDEKFGKGKGWEYVFISPAINRALQAAGRAIRKESDRALIILMDERFAQKRYSEFLPDDMRPERVEGIRKACAEFFGKRSEKEDIRTA